MIIYHNTMSLYIGNRINNINTKSSKVLQKLSSGSRINNAADDSAGLAISEKMKAQIRGLNQAERNIQDGMSLLQTAEGGLTNILEPPLQRMRELCIQASNGTLTDADRNQIQQEVDQIKGEINGVANDTEFNGIKLLDGSLKKVGNVTSSPIIQEPLSLAWEKTLSSDTLINSITSTKDGGFVVAGAKNSNTGNPSESWVEKYDTSGNLIWSKLLPEQGKYNVVYDVEEASNGDLLITSRANIPSSDNEALYYRLDSNGNIKNSVIAYNIYEDYIFSIKETSQDGKIVATGYDGTVLLMNSDMTLFKMKPNIQEYPYERYSSDIIQTNDGYMVIGEKLNMNTGEITGYIRKLKSDLSTEWEKQINDENLSSIIETDDNSFLVLGDGLYKVDSTGNITTANSGLWHTLDNDSLNNNLIRNTINDNNYIVASQNKITKVDSNGDEIWNINLSNSDSRGLTQLNDGSYVVADSKNHIVKYYSDIPQKEITPNNKEGLTIQVGANSSDSMDIYISDMRVSSLSLDNVNTHSIESAENSISMIDAAIKNVSSERSQIGSYVNALNYIHNNISNYEENLTSAELRISDTDMAKEILELTRLNIIGQAAQSLLSQSQKEPERILNLLK